MLEKLRDGSQGLLAKIIVGAIILSFALFGIGNYISGPSQTPAAEVNGQAISLQELEFAYQQQRSRLQQQIGQAFNQYASSPEFIAKIKQDALQSLISKSLMEQKAAQLGLRIGDEQLKAEITKLPYFQVDGKFSNERFLLLLGQNRLSPEQFSSDYRQQLIIQQLQRALAASDFGLPFEAAEIKRLRDQKREMQYISIPSNGFNASIAVTDEALQAHYEQTKPQYEIAETVSVEYVELNQASLKKLFPVTDAEIKAHYDDNIAQYMVPKKQSIAQIQINIEGDEQAAKEKAQIALTKLTQGADFAVIAKSDSQDLFSAASGGELVGYKAESVESSFSSAVNALNVGQLSGIVKTANAFHIIKLLALEPEKIKALSDVKTEIADQLKAVKANEEFFKLQTELSSLAFELPDSLAEVASELKLELKTAKDFSRANAPSVLKNPKVLNVAFDSAMIEKAENSEVIELSPQSLLVIRVTGHTPGSFKELTDVKEQVQQDYVDAQAKIAADAFANDLVKALKSGAMAKELLEQHQLKMSELKTIGRYDADVDAAIAQALFSMAKPAEADAISVEKTQLRNGDMAVVVLTKVLAAEPSDVKDLVGIEQITNEKSNSAVNNMLALLTEQADIKYYKLPN